MRGLAIALVGLIWLLGCSKAVAGEEFILDVCGNCDVYYAQDAAREHKVANRTVEVQVADPINGVAYAFRVRWIREPGFERVDVYQTAIRDEITNAVNEAKVIIDAMNDNVRANPDIVDSARRLYDFPWYYRINLEFIPPSIAPTGIGMSQGSLSHSYTSQYLSSQLNVPTGYLDLMIALTFELTIAYFEGDGSMVLFRRSPLSQVQYEIAGDYALDGDGNIVPVPGGGSSSTGGGSGSGSFGALTVVSSSGGGSGGGSGYCFMQAGYPTYCWND